MYNYYVIYLCGTKETMGFIITIFIQLCVYNLLISLPITRNKVNILSNSEACASDLLEILEDIFSQYYMHSNVISSLKCRTTQ